MIRFSPAMSLHVVASEGQNEAGPQGVGLRSEPIAAVGHPPAEISDGKSETDRPPERQNQIGHQAEEREGGPEDFILHAVILAPNSWTVRMVRPVGLRMAQRSLLAPTARYAFYGRS